MIGDVNTSRGEIYSMNISFSLGPGGTPVDIQNVAINETKVSTLIYNNSTAGWYVCVCKDPSGTGANVLGSGDLGKITLDLSAMS